MRKKIAILCFSLLIPLLLSVSADAQTPPPWTAEEMARNYAPTPAPMPSPILNTSTLGLEVQKVIDYLRANNWNDIADNIQAFLDAGRIMNDSLGKGVLGEIDMKGNVIVDNSWFLTSPWNPDNPTHVGWMMSFASTLVHEKYHAEHHGWWDMIAGNGKHALGGDNDMEIEAWSAGLLFLDDHIIKLLEDYMDETLTENERLRLLKTIKALYNEKITLVDGFNEEEYGPGIWDPSMLRKFRDDMNQKINDVEERKRAKIQEHLDKLRPYEFDVDKKLATAREGFDHHWPQKYAFNTVGIAATIAGLSDEDSFTTDLVLILDFPSDISDEAAEFLMMYDGDSREVTVVPVEEGAAVEADYTLTIAESTLAEIVAQEDPAARARALYALGAFLVTAGVEPVKVEPWAFTLEKDLRQSIGWYNENIETSAVAKLISMVFGNERLNIVFTRGEETATYAVVIRDGIIEDFARGELSDPTMGVTIGYDLIEKIRASPDPAQAVSQALYMNKIRYSIGKGKTHPRYILTKGLARLIGALENYFNRGPFDIKVGQQVDIEYQGQAARLVAKPNNVRVVVIRELHDWPVVDRAGMTLGYTNDFSQSIITSNPETFSPNAGVYLSPGVDAPAAAAVPKYTEYWEDCAYKVKEKIRELQITSSPTEAVYVGLGGARYV